MKLLIGAIVVVAVGSVAIGLSSPDGTVGGSAKPVNQGPRPTASTATTAAEPPDADEAPAPSADRAPASVAGTWPGRPDGATSSGGRVDWCGAVGTTGAAEAERVFGRDAVDAAACAAVRFVFDHRYARLSLPRKEYAAGDFDDVLPALDPATVSAVYRPRIAAFVAAPGAADAGEQLGLVLFTARDTARGAAHASAGNGHVFYGPAFSTKGYAGRAAWINPTWSTVAIRVDRSTSQPRLQAQLTASAATPVFDTTTSRDAMLTVPTRATFVLRSSGSAWLISGWTISRRDAVYAPLEVG